MSSFVEDKDRKIIPRWHDFRQAFLLGELDPIHSRARKPIVDADFDGKLRDWQHRRTLPFAVEVVGAAIVLQREEEAAEAAQFILSSETELPPGVLRLARRVASPAEPERASPDELPRPKRLHELRARLRDAPRNPLCWADLSLQYAYVGKVESSARAMDVAVELAPENRFILRSAVRLYVHKGDPEHAHFLLLRSPATDSDPWLVAAEIAVACILDQTSPFVRPARAMLALESYAPRHLSELASALGTLEISAGSTRRARKLFAQSLTDPTENTVAQARWVYHHLGGIDLDPSCLSTPRSFEARAWAHFHAGNWKDALSESMKWLSGQLFSSRPAILGSYVASVSLQDFNESARLARAGLSANPADPVLLNNLAYSLANSGELGGAEKALAKVRNRKGEPAVDVVRLATAGLLQFRRGNLDQGRFLYRKAIETAGKPGLERLRAKASIFFALEEKRVSSPQAHEAKIPALRLAKAFPDADVSSLLTRLSD